ncbi:TOE1 [Branchiostoma lanceolatum]|uniref:Target of EGR1 protein 1 n=2 Tax=Branchiostoma lanceolatum TaxID=7740 RepID=A0A8J9YXP6_BRALA|nr:TOE1 [Branchiostoma lanceolatum]
MAWFSRVPVVDVTKDNFKELWPTMLVALKTATFVAVDLELSGLGNRRKLNTPSVDDRYKSLAGVARSRAVLSIGLSCFKLNNIDEDGPLVLPFTTQTFNLTLLCSEEYVVEPISLKFLVDHGFDFNMQYSQGAPYHRGADQNGEAPQSVRQLFSELVCSRVPLILHNGLVDLVFLYQSFYTELPSTLGSFLADLSEMFPAGIFDTKCITDFHIRMPASYLEYVFRRSQRENAVHQSKEQPHVTLTFPPYPPHMACVEYRDCCLPDTLLNTTQSTTVIPYCEQYGAHGTCPKGVKCPLSHDPDIIIDQEDWVKAKKKRRRDRKKKKGNKTEDGGQDKTEHLVSMETDDGRDVTSVDGTDSDGQTHTDQSDGGTDNVVAKTRVGCHRAGFDAFMTGFAMATMVCKLGKLCGETNLFTTKFQLEEFANRVYLSGKDFPLQIARSAFAKPSNNHKAKLQRLQFGGTSYQ